MIIVAASIVGSVCPPRQLIESFIADWLDYRIEMVKLAGEHLGSSVFSSTDRPIYRSNVACRIMPSPTRILCLLWRTHLPLSG